VACAPGYVEMPLFCTTFVYAGSNNGSSLNPTLSGDLLGLDGETTWKLGTCADTQSPTTEPTFEPSIHPTLEPTAAPTRSPRCPKEYIFEPADEGEQVVRDCPFGWVGSSITRNCLVGGEWDTTDDDCSLISFTDDFSYYRDELWQPTESSGYDVPTGTFVAGSALEALKSFPPFSGPVRVDFVLRSNATVCGGFDLQLSDELNVTGDAPNENARAYWDCTNSAVELDTASDSVTAAAPSDGVLAGFLQYRRDNDGQPAIIFKAHADADVVTLSQVNGSFNAPQQLYFGLQNLVDPGDALVLDSLALTSFVDWFTADEARAIWTTYPDDVTRATYDASVFSVADPLETPSYVTLSDGSSLASDATQFAFAAPFALRMVYGGIAPGEEGSAAQWSVTLTTTTTRASLFVPSEATYDVQQLVVELGDETLTLRDSAGEVDSADYPVLNDTLCGSAGSWNLSELLLTIEVDEERIAVTVSRDWELSEVCASLEVRGNDTALLSESSLNFDSLSVAPLSGSSVALAYVEAMAGVQEDVTTLAPTAAPTIAPTVVCPYDGGVVPLGANVTAACAFGLSGGGDTGRCLETGVVGEWTEGCFQTSFSDDFVETEDFDTAQWTVVQSEGVPGEAALSDDGTDSLQFRPDDAAYVSLVRSAVRIVWPMRVRAVVSKRTEECNLWAVGLGPEWETRSEHSTRVNWGCLGGPDPTGDTQDATYKQMSLYNDSFRLYDSKCWYDDPAAEEEPAEVQWMEVVFSVRAEGALVTTNTTDCAALRLEVSDIVDQEPWDEAYLWFGTYSKSDEDKLESVNKSVTGRFHSMRYTQFFTDFNGERAEIWDAQLSQIAYDEGANATKDAGGVAVYLAPGERLVADAELFQFALPFVAKLQLVKPTSDNIGANKVPEVDSLADFSSGSLAHYVTFGGLAYVEQATPDTLQIVWDGDNEVRLLYGADTVYGEGLDDDAADDAADACEWEAASGDYAVNIFVNSTHVVVQDEVCAGELLVGLHGLNASTTALSLLSLGYMQPGNVDFSDNSRVAFGGFEAYQYSDATDLNIDRALGVHTSLSSEVSSEDLAELYPAPSGDDTILGMPLWAFILVVCALVLCCCVVYFVAAWNRQMFPFSHKDPSSAHKADKKSKHKVPNSSVQSNEVQRMNSDSDVKVLNARTDGTASQRMVGQANLQQKLIPDRAAEERSYAQQQQQQQQQQSPMAQQQQMGYGQQQQAQMGQMGAMGGMGAMGQMGQQQMMDPNGLQYAMYQQQLFYQQQFMQMMMTNPQQQAILMNMDPLGRKQYIQNQMMIYMSRIAAMQQQNMVPMQQMQQQYMQSNHGMADGEGGAEGTGPDTGSFMEGGMPTNAAMNLGYMAGAGSQMNMGASQGQYGYSPPQQQVEMQAMQQQQQGPATVDIVTVFVERVPVESIFAMCPVGQDGQRRTDANRARLMVARFRGLNPMQVDEHDQAIAYFEFLSLGELKQQLAALPREIFALLLGKDRLDAKDLALAGNGNGGGGAGPALQGGGGGGGADIDFLVDFCEKVNLKQIFGQLEADVGQKGAALNAHHARNAVANLRGATYGQVSGNDPGVALLQGKTMVQLRAYLSSLPLSDLRLLDLKAYHNRVSGGGGGGGVGPMQGGGIVFPTINLNYNGDVRQFKVPKFGCFDEIMGFIMSSWPNLHSFKLMYQDDQASWIRITTNIDVQECIKFAVDQKAAFLSINIIG